MTRNVGTMNICITWYVDCSYSFEYDDIDNATLVTWPLYEECVQGVDALTNDLDECQRTLSEGGNEQRFAHITSALTICKLCLETLHESCNQT